MDVLISSYALPSIEKSLISCSTSSEQLPSRASRTARMKPGSRCRKVPVSFTIAFPNKVLQHGAVYAISPSTGRSCKKSPKKNHRQGMASDWTRARSSNMTLRLAADTREISLSKSAYTFRNQFLMGP